jgi:hypothetical protein
MKHKPEMVYTILHSETLKEKYKAGGRVKFKEGKPWVGAARLLAEATASGREVPIVFAPAEKTKHLIYHGIIRGISISGESGARKTAVTVSDLKPFKAPRPMKIDLVVASTGSHIPAGHIKPYVLCLVRDVLRRGK